MSNESSNIGLVHTTKAQAQWSLSTPPPLISCPLI